MIFRGLPCMAGVTYVNIAATVTCMDENIRKKIEPNGAPSLKRFVMLKEFSKTKASTGLHFMPIIPHLTDGYDNIDTLYSHASDCHVDYVLPGVLYLRGKTRGVFFDFIKQEYPHLYEQLQALYNTGGASKEYKDILYKTVNASKDKYRLSSSYSKPMKEKLNHVPREQLSLF